MGRCSESFADEVDENSAVRNAGVGGDVALEGDLGGAVKYGRDLQFFEFFRGIHAYFMGKKGGVGKLCKSLIRNIQKKISKFSAATNEENARE